MSAAKPDGLLAQHWLLLAVLRAEWATRLDMKVAAEIVERYYSDFKCARVSLRFLENATGAQRPNIIASTRRLVSHGVFSVAREGRGTRPTEYALNFDFGASGIADDTANDNSPSGIADDTSRGIAHDTAKPSSGIAHNTESDLLIPADKAGVSVSKPVSAAAGAPAADAPGAATGFERAFRAYGSLGSFVKGAALWREIDFEQYSIDHIVARARSWAESAKPGKKRMPFEKWLEQRRYMEADRKMPAKEEKPVRRRYGVIEAVGEVNGRGDTPLWTRFDDHDEDEDGEWPVYYSRDHLGHFAEHIGRSVDNLVGGRFCVDVFDDGGTAWVSMSARAAA